MVCVSIIKMNNFFKISIAEAFDEYELHCKARNLSKNTLKRHLEDYKYFDKYYDTYNMCSTIGEDIINRV